MKQNLKQRLYAQNKIRAFESKMRSRFLLLLLALMSFTAIGTYATGDATIDDLGNVLGIESITTATIMGAVGNVGGRNNNAEAAGKKIKYRLYIVSEDQVDTDNLPSRNGIEVGNISLLSGEYWHKILCRDGSPEAKITGEMGDNAGTLKKELSFVVTTMSDELVSLMEDGYGNYFFVVFEICQTGQKWLAGDGCNPMRFTGIDGGFTGDYTGATLTFANENNITYSKYTGATNTQSPDTVAADSEEITLTSNDEYQLSDNTGATEITGFAQGSVTDDDINRVLVIHGSGGSYPATITSSGNFLLQGGTTWTGSSGAKLTVKIVKFNSTYQFMEVYDTRV